MAHIYQRNKISYSKRTKQERSSCKVTLNKRSLATGTKNRCKDPNKSESNQENIIIDYMQKCQTITPWDTPKNEDTLYDNFG